MEHPNSAALPRRPSGTWSWKKKGKYLTRQSQWSDMHVLLSIPGGIPVRGHADWNDGPDYVCMGLNPIIPEHKVSCGCNIVELEVMMACISAPRICKCPCQFSHVLCLQFPCDCHEMTGSGYGAK